MFLGNWWLCFSVDQLWTYIQGLLHPPSPLLCPLRDPLEQLKCFGGVSICNPDEGFHHLFNFTILSTPYQLLFTSSVLSHWLVISSLWDLCFQVAVFCSQDSWFNVIIHFVRKWLEIFHISPPFVWVVLARFSPKFYWYWWWVFLQRNLYGP